MFRLQKDQALPASVLRKFVVQTWGKNLKKPKITFKNNKFVEDVGAFCRKPLAGGGKPGKPVFIVSGQEYGADHSGQLWHCSTCCVGHATKQHFKSSHKKQSCQLFQSSFLLAGKNAWGKNKDLDHAFPYGCPGGKADKRNGPQK